MHSDFNDARSYEEKVLDQGGMLTVREASGMLGLSRSQIYKLMDTGEIAYAQLGGTRRIPRLELVKYLRANMVKLDTANEGET